MGSQKAGRPTLDNSKRCQIKIRAYEEDKALLDECCRIMDTTQYNVIMAGIKKVYKEIKKNG